MKRVLVTGATGFIGAYIMQELIRKNYFVRALHRTGNYPFYIDAEINSKVEWVNSDILDPVSLEEVMSGMDCVIHAAAKVSFSSQDHQQLYHVNREGTANVVNAALEKKINRFVYISSVAAIGRTSDGSTVNEKRKWEMNKTHTQYAISKYQAELEVWRGIGEGLNAVIINPSTVLGYGDWNHSSNGIFKTVFNEMPWYTKGVNGFVDVEDVAKATVLLMESHFQAERFIVNAENISFREIFNKIANGFGKKAPGMYAGRTLGSLAWRIALLKSWFTGEAPVLTKESARVAQSRTLFDNQKILSALDGFTFTPISQTIEKACKRYLTQ
ncbi:MAG TPA: NAD-dependent epimerase/dehydratase family protein [Flavitalea sp.]|nr:NAD-dependent epimerase/dehydratase family protein [Flavitalea sp.]